MGNNKKYKKKPFESNGSGSDTSANIYESMMLSNAWFELSSNQKVLYGACKSQYYSEKRHPDSINTQFFMNQFKWMHKYKLYKTGNQGGFYRDIEVLIKKGFIACAKSGALSRTKNVYRFSDKWQIYGEEAFSINCNEMTLAMIRKRNKNKELNN